MTDTRSFRRHALMVTAGLVLASCGQTRGDEMLTGNGVTSGMSGESGDDETESATTQPKLDTLEETTGNPVGPCGDDTCGATIDLLFVIDNSGSMGGHQLNLASNFPLLIDRLYNLEDSEGFPVTVDFNIMVTTTDVGHPLCTVWQKPDYTPARGAPISDGCNARINRFTGLNPDNPVVIEEACTQNCPVDVVPSDPFIHFSGLSSNVPNDDPAAALSCLGPQGIDGCGYEAPLEAMLQALNPEACWNDPSQEHCQNDPQWAGLQRGFLRPNATLGIAILTDETDCSVQAPHGFSYFTDDETYWETNPEYGIEQSTAAVCRNAGVVCSGPDANGLYSNCSSNEAGDVLQPVSRYIDYLTWMKEELGKEVVMLGIVGVPEVTEYSDTVPYHPIAGGVHDLVYRQWIEDIWPDGDILPEKWDLGVRRDHLVFDNGQQAWGCVNPDGFTGAHDPGQTGPSMGEALPPVRIKEVCESLDYVDANGQEQIRCCLESICSPDFSAAINCLTGVIQTTIPPAG
jgi:hypothetical protein